MLDESLGDEGPSPERWRFFVDHLLDFYPYFLMTHTELTLEDFLSLPLEAKEVVVNSYFNFLLG